jgi:CRISPR-associated endonuclease Cas1/group II intron reverse transcriptase/maturase
MKVSLEELAIAWHLVQKGSQSAGIDGITVDLFAGIAGEQLRWIQQHIHQERYIASPAKGFYLPKKDGGQRLVGIPTVQDRIVQRFLLQRTYPKLDRAMGKAAFAYRPGYGTLDAIERVAEAYAHQPAWVVKADIQSFFDNLSWTLLCDRIERLKLASILNQLMIQQVKAGLVINGYFCRPNKGVLQGGILSGALANLYLSQFDRQCLNAGINLVRYGDDCLAVCRSPIEANRAISLMAEWLEAIYLQLHPEKTHIFAPDQEFIFLGYRFSQGEIYPPERKSSALAKPKPLPKPSAARPLVCGIVKGDRDANRKPNHEYWKEGMSTLYISDQGAYLKVQQQQFQVFHQQQLRCSVPINRVSHVVLFGCCTISHGAVSLALQHRIPVMYLSSSGRYFGRLQTAGQAKVEYLSQQVLHSQDPTFVLAQAQSIVIGKLHNSRVVLQRLNRKRKTDLATKAIADLAEVIQRVPSSESVESLLGFEGYAASVYFPAFASLLSGKFEFEKRTRRPPTDPINSLLSLGYTLLSQNIHSMIEAIGLHTHFGNLHTPRPNLPALVCDLMEEFRAPVVDSFVAYLINSNIFAPDDFTPPDARGGVYLHPDGLKRFLKHWEEKLATEVVHPHTGFKVSYRRCMELQVWEYVACLGGEHEVYRPMKWEK